MTYKETTEWLFKQLSFYQRDGKIAYKGKLDNTLALDEALGKPHTRYKTIHIAGTNGKGSTSHLLASILMESGYKVGLYTSPHLKDFKERIVINGMPIEENYVVSFVSAHRKLLKEVNPSFFEMTVAMAFSYFEELKVDYAVIETGLGGRLDSTNIITPVLSVITNISMDHSDILGDTVRKIAAEKAGIIKQGVPTVVGRAEDGIKDIFIEKACEMYSALYFAPQAAVFKSMVKEDLYQTIVYTVNGEDLAVKCPLMGDYQRENIATVLAATSILAHQDPSITDSSIRTGIEKISQNMPLRGRWETLCEKPLTICDTAHNYDGIQQVCRQLMCMGKKPLYIVWGMVGDKDASSIIPLLPRDAEYFICAPSIQRAMPVETLAGYFADNRLKYTLCETPKDALAMAQMSCSDEGMVFAGGSNFVVAEII